MKKKSVSGEEKSQNTGTEISRRSVLGSAVSATSIALVPLASSSCSTPVQQQTQVLSSTDQQVLEALVDRLIPADDNGAGALEAGAASYINNSLNDWNSGEKDSISEGLQSLDKAAQNSYGQVFPELSSANKDALLVAMEAGQLAGFDNSQAIFNRLRRLTLEGMFSDPYYGGNKNYVGWDLIGYPGAVMASTPDMQRMGGRIPPLHTSAYGSNYDGE